MKTVDELTAYARDLADVLEQDMRWERGQYSGGWWTADPAAMYNTITSRAAAGLEFLRQYSGDDSHWMRRATAIYESRGDGKSVESGARAVGEFLRSWADQVEAGVIAIVGSQAHAEIGVVSTDVMTQVRRLLEEKQVHPAAPIVLCGAALETALRATVQANNLILSERPSISAYGRLLRSSGLLTAQDMKDIEQCGGLRNAAAHGDFDSLSSERAGLMEQQTNLLLRRLDDLSSPR